MSSWRRSSASVNHNPRRRITDTAAFFYKVFQTIGETRRSIEQTYESQNLAPEDIDHEVVARYVEEHLLTDEAAIRDAVQRNRSFGQWMRDQLDKVLAKLGNEDARERVTLQKARDLYAQALKEKAASRGETDGRLRLPKVGTQQSLTEETEGPIGLKLPQVQDESGPEITKADVDALLEIGSKNVVTLNSEELRKAAPWARKFNKELGVKSPFFRAWFGDWRAKETTPAHVVSADMNAQPNSGKEKNQDTGRMMSWNKDMVRESILNTPEEFKDDIRILGTNIRGIVQNAVLFDTEISRRDSKRKMPGTAFMHRFYALADIDGKTVLVKMFAEEALSEKTNEAFTRAYSLKYVQKVADIDNGVHSKGGLTGSPSATKYSVADLYALVKQYDRDFKSLPSSKIVNADGTPKVMYRGDMADFTVFDRKKARGSNLYGRGFYFTDSESHAKQYGKVRAFYLDVKQPLSPGQNEITREQMRAFLEAVAENEDDYDLQNYGYGATVDSVLDQVYGKGDFEMLQDVSATAIGDMVEAVELFNEVNGTKYDGIITGTETVTFQSTQNKSATDNIGTYDRRNPDIEHSFTEEEEGPRGLRLPKVEDEADGRMRASAPTESEVDAAAEEQTEKKAKKPVAESRPIEARRWLNRQTIDKFGIPEGKRKAAAETVQRYADKMIDRGEVTEQDVAELFNALLYEGVVDVVPDDYSRTMREIVTGGKIHASASVKADFGDDWSKYSRSSWENTFYLYCRLFFGIIT